MLTAKQRASVEKALASDPKPTRKPSPPSIVQLLDWLEWRALRICNVRRTSDEQVTWELAWRAQRTRDWLAELPNDTSWASAGGAMWNVKWKRSKIADDVKRADRAIASANWVGHARTALAKRDTAALAFAVLMAERSFHDPRAERSERARREHVRRVSVLGGKSRGKGLLERDAELKRTAVDLARRRPAWSVSEIARQLEKARHVRPGWRRIAAIIAPAVADARQS